jgi:hypothetical protein
LSQKHLKLNELDLERRKLQLRVSTRVRAPLHHRDRADRGEAEHNHNGRNELGTDHQLSCYAKGPSPLIARNAAELERTPHLSTSTSEPARPLHRIPGPAQRRSPPVLELHCVFKGGSLRSPPAATIG